MDGGNVLRFGLRGVDDGREQPMGGGQFVGEPEPWDDWGDGGRYYGAGREGGLGDLTQVVLVGANVVDVVSRPVQGSDYEFAVLELEERGLYRRPSPPPTPPPLPVPPAHEQQLAWLASIVGGVEALDSLDATPLTPAPLDLDGVPAHLRDRVAAIAEWFEPWAPLVLGDEGVTAARRLLTRAAATEPGLLRSERDDIAAGAVVWAVAKGNDLVGPNRPVRAMVIQELAGLRSSPATRGAAFAHAVGGVASQNGRALWMYDAQPAVIPLGSPDLLLGRFRRRLMVTRDLALQLRARTPAAI